MSQKFIELAVELEAFEDAIKMVREEMVKEMELMKVGTFVQDPSTLLVYQIVEPKGSFVYFKKIDYIRTAKPTEDSGTLSQKKAKEAGFTLVAK